MAKKKTRVVYRKAPKKKVTRRRKAGGSKKVEIFQAEAMIYGGLREKLSNFVAPFVGKIPVGNLADEVGCGAVAYAAAKYGSGKIKEIGMKGLVIENARIGEAIADGSIMGNQSQAPTGGTRVI